jgi:hypothetical protein
VEPLAKPIVCRPTGTALEDEREYEVQLPNHRAIYLNEDDCEVRCLQPLDDPTEVLAIGGSESQFLHDRLPDAVKKDLQEAHADLNTAARVWLWSLLFMVWTIWAWWAAPVGIIAAIFVYYLGTGCRQKL